MIMVRKALSNTSPQSSQVYACAKSNRHSPVLLSLESLAAGSEPAGRTPLADPLTSDKRGVRRPAERALVRPRCGTPGTHAFRLDPVRRPVRVRP
jgi:hypothetical protein